MARSDALPSSFLRRTVLYRALEREGARFEEIDGAAVAMNYGRSLEDERVQASKLGLADLSPLARIGFKGAETITWLRKQGVEIGEHNNEAWVQPDGELAARLADNEVLILGNITSASDLCERLERACSFDSAPRCYPVPRRESYAWFIVSGAQTSAMFAKLCGVDLRVEKFPAGSVAQTSVARMSAIVIRHDLNDVPAFDLLFDSASADYLWACLRDAMREFDGGPIGLAALQALARR
ncbi:MAG: sarcosine oxidase subunit gamma family protein [Acidiferrobacterales bacterium]